MVVVSEDEILRRSQVNSRDDSETEEVNYKISFAKYLAWEMERGSEVIPMFGGEVCNVRWKLENVKSCGYSIMGFICGLGS